MKRTFIVLVCILFCFCVNIFATPTFYIERIGGTDLVSTYGNFLVVFENPTNGEPIGKLKVIVPAGFSLSSSGGYVSVLGRGKGDITDISSEVSIEFTTPLMPGSVAYVFLTNLQNPSSIGQYNWSVVAYGVGNNLIPVGVKPGKSSGVNIVSYLGFRNVPYGRVVLTSGNGTAGSGLKQVNIGNTFFTYILYHPFGGGDRIKRIILSVPPQFASVAGTVLTITNLNTGAQLTNFTVGAIGANLPKVFYLDIPPTEPGNVLLITLSLLTLPTSSGSYTWECYVEGESGQIVKVRDMPGFVNPQQTIAIAAPSAGWYGDVYPFFSIPHRLLSWPTAGTSNNVYRIVMWRTTAWAANSDPRMNFPVGFGISQGGIIATQANGAGSGAWVLTNIGGVWFVSNDITAAGAANNNLFVSVTNVINPSSPGNYTFDLVVGDGVGVLSTLGYDRVVNIVPHLFTNIPRFGIEVVGATTNTNDLGIYLFVLSNPTNSGDAIDRIDIVVPSGYMNVIPLTNMVSFLNSAARLLGMEVVQPTGTTTGRITLYLDPSYPLGEGGTVYLPIVVTNPSSVGDKVWNCMVSGVRDVTNIPALVISGMTNRVRIVGYAPFEEVGYAPANIASTNVSSDGMAWLIVTNSTFSDTSMIQILRLTNVPPPTVYQSNEYIFIGNAYSFYSSLSPNKPVRVRLYFSNDITNLVSPTNTVANFKLARYDEVSGSWEIVSSSVVGDGYVEATTMVLGRYMIWEYRGSTGGTMTNVFLVSKVGGGKFRWDSGKVEVEFGENSLQVDGYLAFDTLTRNSVEYKPLPNYLLGVIDKQYRISLSAALTKPAVISIYYTEEEVRGRVIESLSLAYYDESEGRWIVVPSYVDKEKKRVYARTYHFSLWTLVENRTPLSDLVSKVYIYPNPAKDRAIITFSLNDDSRVFVEVYDFSGRKVATLVEGEVVRKGTFEKIWDFTSNAKVKVVNGVYFVKIYAQSIDLKKQYSNVYKLYVGK